MIDTQKLAEFLLENVDMARIDGHESWTGVPVEEIKDTLDEFFKLYPVPRSQEEIDMRYRYLFRKVENNIVWKNLLIDTLDFPAGTNGDYALEAVSMCYKLGTMYERWPLEEYP